MFVRAIIGKHYVTLLSHVMPSESSYGNHLVRDQEKRVMLPRL